MGVGWREKGERSHGVHENQNELTQGECNHYRGHNRTLGYALLGSTSKPSKIVVY